MTPYFTGVSQDSLVANLASTPTVRVRATGGCTVPAWRHGVMVGLPSTQWTDGLAFPGVITPGEGWTRKQHCRRPVRPAADLSALPTASTAPLDPRWHVAHARALPRPSLDVAIRPASLALLCMHACSKSHVSASGNDTRLAQEHTSTFRPYPLLCSPSADSKLPPSCKHPSLLGISQRVCFKRESTELAEHCTRTLG